MLICRYSGGYGIPIQSESFCRCSLVEAKDLFRVGLPMSNHWQLSKLSVTNHQLNQPARDSIAQSPWKGRSQGLYPEPPRPAPDHAASGELRLQQQQSFIVVHHHHRRLPPLSVSLVRRLLDIFFSVSPVELIQDKTQSWRRCPLVRSFLRYWPVTAIANHQLPLVLDGGTGFLKVGYAAQVFQSRSVRPVRVFSF